jgi:acyl-CoA dehydrogenase
VDFELTEDQAIIRKAVAELAARSDDQYWLEKDSAHEFPAEFYHAFAEAGWLGITTPEEYGGHGFGITEASIVIEEVAKSGGGMNAASAVHLSIFGLHRSSCTARRISSAGTCPESSAATCTPASG